MYKSHPNEHAFSQRIRSAKRILKNDTIDNIDEH